MPPLRKAGYRTRVPKDVKERLLKSCKNKCANPGCSTTLLQIHHISQWHVYGTHDPQEMICLCATCHDCTHRGELHISEETVRLWRGANGRPGHRAPFLIEPDLYLPTRLLLGTILFEPALDDRRCTIFRMAERFFLGFQRKGNDIILMDAALHSPTGEELLKVGDGLIQCKDDRAITFESRPGRTSVAVSAASIPDAQWALDLHQKHTGSLLSKNRSITLFDLEVPRHGLGRLRGLWWNNDLAAVATDDQLCLMNRQRGAYCSFITCDDAGQVTKSLDKLPVFRCGPTVDQGFFDGLFTAMTSTNSVDDNSSSDRS